MLSYTSLYALFALTSIMLMNSLILLARYVQQVKKPPEDSDFESLLKEKARLEAALGHGAHELMEFRTTNEELQKEVERLKAELEGKKNPSEAIPSDQSTPPIAV